MSLVTELTHHMALVPLAWLAWLRVRGERRDTAWWWLAGAMAVSWVADSAAHVVDPWFVSAVYPVTQAALIVAVVSPRPVALIWLATLVIVGMVAIGTHGAGAPDLLLHTVASGSVVVTATTLPSGRLRCALMLGFGAVGLTWLGYAVVPGWPSWLAYQGARALGLGLLCWAATRPQPRLRLA